MPDTPTLEGVLTSVWRQTFVDGAKYVEIAGVKYPVRTTSKRKLRQVDFRFEDRELRGLEQNPETMSRWAKDGKRRKEGNAIS